jgi:hypothetical protein
MYFDLIAHHSVHRGAQAHNIGRTVPNPQSVKHATPFGFGQVGEYEGVCGVMLVVVKTTADCIRENGISLNSWQQTVHAIQHNHLQVANNNTCG